jgi:hypothetical protein
LLSSCARPAPPPAEPEAEPAGEPRALEYFDIAHAYHGLLLDGDLKVIELNKAVIERLQDSMLESLTAVPDVELGQEARAPLDRTYIDKVLSGFEFTDDERILTKSALIQQGIDLAPSQEKLEYQWRFDLIHERSLHYLDPKVRELRSEFEQYLSGLAGLLDLIRRLLQALLSAPYLDECRANSVPIPPDWPTGGWSNPGALPFRYNFLQSGPDTQVWMYEAPGGQGLCYALPRQDGDFVNLLGIICQSESTGKACFWDNIDILTGAKITGVGITLEISRLKNGFNLAENCTQCHRGGNVFLIHPETPLGTPTDRQPAVRYAPIGQAGWSNPPAFAAPGSGACAGCHEIAALNSSICVFLQQAAELTMPSVAAPAGWASPIPAYSAHITVLKTACAGGGPAPPPPPTGTPCSGSERCCGTVLPDGTCDGQCWPSGNPCP